MRIHLPSIISGDRLHELRQAAEAAPPGNFVEVGVYMGGSAQHLYDVAREQGRQIYLFDTFCGMPHCDPERDRHPVGDFGDVHLPGLQAAMPEAHFCVGVFPATLVETGPIALAHIDCDQYQSVRDCIVHLVPRMVAGGLMIFDDYVDLLGARQAVNEMLGAAAVTMSPQGRARVRF